MKNIIKNYFYKLLIVFLIGCTYQSVKSQVSPGDAGFLDVTQYGATPDDNSDNDEAAINSCIVDAIDQGKGVFIPAGDYHVSGGIIVDNSDKGCDQFIILTGSTKDPAQRTRIILKENSGDYTVIEGKVFDGSCHGNSGWTDTYHRVLRHIDIKIESGNTGAKAVRWRGAEGCGIYDVHVDLSAEPSAIGFQNLPGSGGSTHTISVIGGKIALDLEPYDNGYEGSQPGPTVSGGYFEGQSDYVAGGRFRGMLNLVGCHFKVKNDVLVVKDLRRMGEGGYGGTAGLTDCIIEYESSDGENIAISSAAIEGNGFHWANVYVKNLDFIVGNKKAHNPDGWTFYEEVAYDNGFNFTNNGILLRQGIFIDKQLQTEDNIWVKGFINDVNPPADLCTRHKIPLPFPSFEWTGAVNIEDYSGFKDGDDWAPAFNEALNQSQIVVVPDGDFMVKSTIHLKSNSIVLGLSHEKSQIYSSGSKNFDTSTDPYTDPRPIMETPDDASATCIISDIALKPGIPIDGNDHTPGAVGGYPLLWQAGRNSVIKHIDIRDYELGHFRDHFCFSRKDAFSDINLKDAASPLTDENLTFKTYNTTGAWTDLVIDSRFMLETHSDNQRLVAAPYDEVHDVHIHNLPYKTPNITITKNGGGTFDITSLKLGNADFNSSEFTITIKGFEGVNVRSTKEVLFDTDNPRPELKSVTLDWSGVDSVVITAKKAFYIDDVAGAGSTSGFESITGTTIQYDTRVTQPMYQHLNINPEVHDKVLITGNGGGRWYNFQLHGKQWLQWDKGYVRIKDNKEPLKFYHLHSQHGHQKARVIMKNAQFVSVFGTKIEIPTSFMRIYNSDNIRIFGHGGMTNPLPGHNDFYFENCTNYSISGLSGQTWPWTNYPGDEFNELVKCAIQDQLYLSLKDVTDGVQYDPTTDFKPILWRVGNPLVDNPVFCANSYSLQVTGGYGSESVCQDEKVVISAAQPPCEKFIGWTGDVQFLEDPAASTTFVTMPGEDVSVTANFEAYPQRKINITDGTATETEACAGSVVRIDADGAPGGYMFNSWTGDTQYLDNPNLSKTILVMPDADVNLGVEYVTYDRPYKVHTIPGKIECEYYDYGGQGVAYNDNNSKQGDGTFRPEDNVDVVAKEEASNGYSIGWTQPGEWVEYTINNVESGNYNIIFSYASNAAPGDLLVKLDDEVLHTFTDIEISGSWTNFVTITAYNVPITGGNNKILHLEFVGSGNFDLDAIEFVATGPCEEATEINLASGQTVKESEQITLTPITVPQGACRENYTWNSSDNSIATVDNNGVVTGVSKGVATITLTSDNGLTASCDIEVLEASTPAGVVSNMNKPDYELGVILPDEEFYIDRTYLITSAPDYLNGHTLIKTANGDKKATDSPFLTFDVDKEVDVYVMYDNRADIPSWLSEWTKMEETLIVRDGDNEFNIYTKSFPAGQVALGGNEGAGAMYIVGIVPQEDPNAGSKITSEYAVSGNIPEIDGEFSDWDSYSSYSLDLVGKGVGEVLPEDISASFKCAWTNTAFYFYIDITDDVAGTQFFNETNHDNMELYFDMDNSKLVWSEEEAGGKWNRLYDENDHQIRINRDLDGYFPTENFPEAGAVSISKVETATGWAVELSIPFDSLMMDFNAANDVVIGFDVMVGDNDDLGDGDGKKETIIALHDETNNAWKDPSLMGELTLSGETVSTGMMETNSVAYTEGNEITLDGDFSDWDGFEQVALSRFGKGETTDDDLSAVFKTTFDANSIYFMVEVTDDIAGTNFHNETNHDNIELFFDMDNSKIVWNEEDAGGKWTPLYDENDHQIRFDRDVDSYTATEGFPQTDGCTIEKVETDNGWAIEIAIPFSGLMPDFDPADGTVIGFDIMVGDNDDLGDGDGKKESILAFNDETNNAWKDASLMGTMTLLGEAVTSINEFQLGSFSIYPNPASTVLNIQIDGYSGIAQLKLIDLAGRTIISKNIINDHKISVAAIDSGVYVLQVRMNNKYYSKKVIIE